jgi:hypothetical protein
MWGAAAGACFYLAVLLYSRILGGPLRHDLGCTPSVGYEVLNLPPSLLSLVIPNETFAPQELRAYTPRRREGDRWSPTGFVLLGVTFYGLIGFVVGRRAQGLMTK